MKRAHDHYGQKKAPVTELPLFSGAPCDDPPIHQTPVKAHTRTLSGEAALRAQEEEAERDLDTRFAAFDQANPFVFAQLKDRAIARHRNNKPVRVKRILEDLRDEMDERTTTQAKGEAKLNNSLFSRYARKLIAEVPELRGVVKTRTLKQEAAA